MNILISGASGFIGRNLSKKFVDHGFTNESLDIGQMPEKEFKIAYHWNGLEELNINHIDTVIHLAGKAHDTRKISDEQSYFDINTGLTKKIFDKFLESDASKFIFFSSVKAAAEKVSGDSLSEDVIPLPVGPYGESKFKAEEYILARMADNACKLAGKSVYILRPCMIHGPGNKGNLNLLYKLVSKGIPWPLGSFDNKRSFTSIDNLSFIVEKLVSEDIESGIYHIADDEPLSTSQLVELIAFSVGKKSHILNINKALINGLAKLGNLLHMPFNTFRLQKLTESYVVSNDKIKRAIGVDRLPLKASEGMAKTLASFKKT
ncbi:MAG: nucleoside-diphosphate-sugar epimerase [Bacteroidetes bacterium GWF2_40_14]|nr:MAG: nucleoside-diphosphate-sugar epimerase [Bacteroidetes bacterium GWF2_40_14]